MTKHRKTKEVIVQSTMRLPRSLWRRINKVADMKRLSMAQTVERAVVFYCYANEELDYDSSPLQEIDWKFALNEMKRNEQRKRAEERRKRAEEKRTGVRK